jgi:putative addiction module component (TIGR02574 family)
MDLLTHDELVRLTPPERLALISQLWDSLEDDQLTLTAAQRVELDRRLETLDQDRREGITWAALKTELEQRCPQCAWLSSPGPPALS